MLMDGYIKAQEQVKGGNRTCHGIVDQTRKMPEVHDDDSVSWDPADIVMYVAKTYQ
jgi:hypothetical protein